MIPYVLLLIHLGKTHSVVLLDTLLIKKLFQYSHTRIRVTNLDVGLKYKQLEKMSELLFSYMIVFTKNKTMICF